MGRSRLFYDQNVHLRTHEDPAHGQLALRIGECSVGCLVLRGQSCSFVDFLASGLAEGLPSGPQ